MRNNTGTLTAIALIITSGLVSSPALANADLKHFYIGAGISHSSFDINQLNMAAAYGTSPTDEFKIQGSGLNILMGFQVDPHLAFELSYADLGSVALDNDTVQRKVFDAEVINLSSKLSMPVSEDIEAFAKVGLSYWSTLDDDMDSLESGSGISYGAGIDINVYGNKDRIMRVEWHHQTYDEIVFNGSDTVSLSAVFKF